MTSYRRNFIRTSLSLVFTGTRVFPLLGQQRGSGGLRPPEPAEQMELILRRDREVPHRAAPPVDRRQQLGRYLDQLCDCAARLREEIRAVEVNDNISVAVYKQTQELERLAKQLKALAKG